MGNAGVWGDRRAAVVGALLFIGTSAPGCLIESTPGFTDDGASTSVATTAGTTSVGTGPDTSGTTEGTSSDGGTDGPEPVGYEPRPCGLDLGREGAEDDCALCSPAAFVAGIRPAGGAPVRWVDCDGGTDPAQGVPAACEDAEAPCATLERAFASLPGRDIQSIVCFAGRCTPNALLHPTGGARIPKTRDGFTYPARPAMLVGMDRNGDGVYPPLDDPGDDDEALEDDVAVIDTSDLPIKFDGTDTAVFEILGGDGHDLELAHFSVEFVEAGDLRLFQAVSAAAVERVYLHDLAVVGARRGRTLNDDFPIIDVARDGASPGSPGAVARDLAIEHARFTDHGGALLDLSVYGDGEMPGAVSGVRIASVTTSGQGCEGAQCVDPYQVVRPEAALVSVLRAAGDVSGVTILDSDFDAGTTAWVPATGSFEIGAWAEPPTALVLGECSRQAEIRNNRFTGFGAALRLEATSFTYDGRERCSGGSVTDVTFEGNIVTVPAEGSLLNPTTIAAVDLHQAQPGLAVVRGTLADIRVFDNVFGLSLARNCVRIAGAAGAEAARGLVFAHDTCDAQLVGDEDAAGLLVRGSELPADLALVNLLLAVRGAGSPVAAVAAPDGVRADWVVAGSVFGGASGSLEAWPWEATLPLDLAICEPVFAADGYHLDPGDVCARDQGSVVELSFDPGSDIDDQPRDATPDVGADEYVPR